MAEIAPIRSDDDHRNALREIETLWDAEAGSADANRLEVLAILVEDYENRKFKLDDELNPVQVLRLAMAEMGHSQADLSAILGSRSRASEVLSGKRHLSTDAVYRISRAWRIPAELLVAPKSARSVA